MYSSICEVTYLSKQVWHTYLCVAYLYLCYLHDFLILMFLTNHDMPLNENILFSSKLKSKILEDEEPDVEW